MDETKKNPEVDTASTPVNTEPPAAQAAESGSSIAPVTTESVAPAASVAEPATATAADTPTSAEPMTAAPVTTAPLEASPGASAPESVASMQEDTTATQSGSVWQGYAIAAVIIALMMAGVWYVLERDGRVTTSIFTGDGAGLFRSGSEVAAGPAAIVNGVTLTAERLQPSIDQITQNAVMQGADPADPEVAVLIRQQALEMLINTELLMQAAAADGIEVSDEEVAARLAQIEEQVGGPEALELELADAGVSVAQLRDDIVTEITIQTLLTQVVGEGAIEVTEAEIVELYDAAGGEAAGIPPLSEVRDQVIAQIQQTKEQDIVQEYLAMLRLNAEIEELI